MNNAPQITCSIETLEELARIICSLCPTMTDFWNLLGSVRQQISGNQYSATNALSPFLHQQSNSASAPYYQPNTTPSIRSDPNLIEQSLQCLNQTPGAIALVIKTVFNPQKYRNQAEVLREKISQFNTCLAYDGWRIQVQSDGTIGFLPSTPDISPFLEDQKTSSDWARQIQAISWEGITSNPELINTLNYRLKELQKCLEHDFALSTIILSGGILEGVLRAIAEAHPKAFNSAPSCHKDKITGKPIHFRDWPFASLINVATEVGFLNEGSKKFNQTLRDFRNYVHPYLQIEHHFSPDIGTARLCFQTMKESILHIQQKLKTNT